MGDLAGLDIGYATRKRKAAEAGVPLRPSVADKLAEAGRLGQKTGAGWYRYEAGNRDPIPDPATEALIAEFRSAQGITPRAISDEEVVERCIFALVNEGARILEEGIAARASDLDVVYLNGYGFPDCAAGRCCTPTWWACPTSCGACAASPLNRVPTRPGSLRRCWCAWPKRARLRLILPI
jgi:3-hydroxyacyl-CoA dehydrogenase